MENLTVLSTLQIVLFGIAFVAIFLTIIPLFKFSHWFFRLGDFPRLQIAVICLFLMIIVPLFNEIDYLIVILEFILTFCFAYQISRIFPYTRFHSKQVQRSTKKNDRSTIKIIISNVLFRNRNAGKLLELIKENDPDVILLAEVDEWWDSAVEGLKKKYPNYKCKPLDNAYGMNFYTRLETNDLKLNYFVQDDIPSIETEIILDSGEKIKFYGLHPRPPIPTETKRSAERDAELLIVGKKIKKSDTPTIIAGDFNDVAWSETTNLFQKISGLLDSRIGRGFYNSFHANIWFLRMPLDHVFQSNHFRLVELRRLESIGSDHFPIFINLSLEQNAEKDQDELEDNKGDRDEADKKIEEGID